VAGREQIAADDDSTHYSAVEQGNAGLRRDRAAIDDVADERRCRVLLRDGGRAEPDTDAAGGERAVIGDAAREGRNRNRGNAGVCRPDSPSVDNAAGDNGIGIESNTGVADRKDRAAVDDAAGKVRDELYKNAAAMSRYGAAIDDSVGNLGNVVDLYAGAACRNRAAVADTPEKCTHNLDGDARLFCRDHAAVVDVADATGAAIPKSPRNIPDEDTGAEFARNFPAVTDAAAKRRCVSHNNGTTADGDRPMTGDRNAAGHDAAADQNTCVACNNPAAVDDGAVDGAAAKDGDAGRRAGDEVAVEEAAGQERAADDGDAARSDRAGVGDAATEVGGADHHGAGMAAELGWIWPRECHEVPQRPVRPIIGSNELFTRLSLYQF
jgi:hypothetical protein